MSTSNVSRPGGPSRPGRLLALLSATVVAASLLSAPTGQATAAASPLPADAGPRLVSAEPVSVTLITGDTVHWQGTGEGNPRVEVEPAPRDYPVEFQQSGSQDDFYIIPTDAMAQVAAGTLDVELFNIPGLIRQGLDDASTGDLPVIVTFDRNRSSELLAHDASTLPATSNATAIESMNGAGVTVNRSNAGSFRKVILGTPGLQDTARAASARGLEGAVDQVLLDQVLEIDLAESVPQIGAPHVWAAGYTGKGVTVAVLDSGIDVNHPDLVGQVVAAENFTTEPDATDTHGHGTHVASTIAGTGAGSDGGRTGVAPDARLLSGKVCTSTGDCQLSAIMAGMEWATEQGADIVNMSLSGDPTDGTDPLSQLVNTLSAETGTLFVTSAGNRRCGGPQVGTPAAADAALAVGAVDKNDKLASFSSCGPRLGDHAVKPEITAPGVGIIAARAAGTSAGSPVDNRYTSMQGTSMASPHVAGAAALLAQARGHTGRELKDALVSTATDVGRLWRQQGAGRVDLVNALQSPIYAQGSVNFGQVTDRTERGLTYTNHGDTDITLSLEAIVTDDRGQVIDAVGLSTKALTVPAGGRATATLTVNAADGERLVGGGVVTATGEGVRLRTGIGFGPPRHSVTIEVLDSKGNRIGSDAAPDWIVHLHQDTYDPASPDGSLDYRLTTNEGIARAHVPAGIYTLSASISEQHPETGEPLRSNLLIEVEKAIDGDSDVTLDARNAVPMQVTVPREVEKRNLAVSLFHQRTNVDPRVVTNLPVLAADRPVYVTPAPPGELGFVALWAHWTLAEPQPLQSLPFDRRCPRLRHTCYSDTPGYVYNIPVLYENGIPKDLHKKFTRQDLVEVPTRYHSDQSDDVYIDHRFEVYTPFLCGIGCGGLGASMWMKPGDVTEYLVADDRFTWVRGAFPTYAPEGTSSDEFGQASSDWFPASEAGAKRIQERWFEGPLRSGAVDLRGEYFDAPQDFGQRFATASRGGADGNQFIPGYSTMDNTRGHLIDAWPRRGSFASWRMWDLDTGNELAGVDYNPRLPGVPAFTLAPRSATYGLEQITDPVEVGGLFLTGQSTTTWTFTSQPTGAEVPIGYTCPHPVVDQSSRACQIQPLIQLEYKLDLDLHNQVPAGRAHRFSILAGHHSHAINRAPITSLQVQASFDDGDTWQSARVLGRPKNVVDTGGFLPSSAPYQQFQVVLLHTPLYRTNGYVSLRVRATDANGGAVEQTIHRAYILR